jgi:uncharacterized protein YqhQ
MGNKFRIGGNALPNGIAMHSEHFVASARRLTNGTIDVTVTSAPARPKHWMMTMPFLRGVVSFALMFALLLGGSNKKMRFVAFVMMSGFAGMIGAGYYAEQHGLSVNALFGESTLVSSAIGALANLLLLCALMLNPKVRTLLRYHGAEHQCVHAAEKNIEITPDSVRDLPLIHPRCGTGVFALYLLGSTTVGALMPPLSTLESTVVGLITMVLLFSIIYEIIILNESERWGFLARPFMLPGAWLQRLSVWKPDREQLEVACAATNAVLNAERNYLQN